MSLDGATILVTGGTGRLGRALISLLLRETRARQVVALSRQPEGQRDLRQTWAAVGDRLRCIVGDVRSERDLQRAFRGVDAVVHAASLGPEAARACPQSLIQTNIFGAQNVINAARDRQVGRVLALSTPEAACPGDLYGATRLCAERLFLANAPRCVTRFGVARLGRFVPEEDTPDGAAQLLSARFALDALKELDAAGSPALAATRSTALWPLWEVGTPRLEPDETTSREAAFAWAA